MAPRGVASQKEILLQVEVLTTKCTQAWTRKTCPFLDLRFMRLFVSFLSALHTCACWLHLNCRDEKKKKQTAVAEALNGFFFFFFQNMDLDLCGANAERIPSTRVSLALPCWLTLATHLSPYLCGTERGTPSFSRFRLLLREPSARLQRKGMCCVAPALRVGLPCERNLSRCARNFTFEKKKKKGSSVNIGKKKRAHYQIKASLLMQSEQITKGFHKQDGRRPVSTYSICTREKQHVHDEGLP